MNRRRLQMVLAAGVAMLLAAVGVAIAGGRGGDDIRERLSGYEEVPAVSTGASGTFKADISRSGERIDYRLSYRDLEGDVLFAHIHFGAEHTNGGVSAFLCGGGGAPDCPQSGTVEGSIEAEDVVGPEGQGIAPGELDELVDAIRAGVAYANVHSSTFPTGEIRAQFEEDRDRGRGRHRGHDDDDED